MKNEEKPIGRGKFAVMAWEEAKKCGGLSYGPMSILWTQKVESLC